MGLSSARDGGADPDRYRHPVGVVVITGAGNGIGQALALEYGRAGYQVAVTDIDFDRAVIVAQEIITDGGVAHAYRLDASDVESWAECIDAVVRRFGPLTHLFNNAGIVSVGWPLVDMPWALWRKTMDVNLDAVAIGIRTCAPLMIQAGGGYIVNTSSMQGLDAKAENHSAYVASKHAVVGLSDALRAEMARHGIQVSVLCPGPTDTSIRDTSRHLRDEVLASVGAGDMASDRAPDNPLSPRETARLVRAAVGAGQFFIMSHPELRGRAYRRFAELEDGFSYAERQSLNPDSL